MADKKTTKEKELKEEKTNKQKPTEDKVKNETKTEEIEEVGKEEKTITTASEEETPKEEGKQQVDKGQPSTQTEKTEVKVEVDTSAQNLKAETPTAPAPAQAEGTGKQQEINDSLSEGIFELESEEASGSKTKIIMIIVGLLIVAGLVIGGYFLYKSRKEKIPETPVQIEEKQEETSQPTKKEEDSTSTASAEKKDEEVDLADYQVQVLNGSGIAGEAGNVKDLLEDTGFREFDIGNADSYDYTDTKVKLKKDTPDAVFKAIEDALGKDYTVSKGDSLSEDSDYDVIVVTGIKKE